MCAKIIVTQGKNVLLDRGFALSGPPAAIQSGSVDDSTTTLTAGTTTLGSPSNFAADDFDTASRSGLTVTVTFSFGTAAANFTHRRIVIHNVAAASVTGTSATVICGHDQQSIVKNSSTQITYTFQLLAA